MEMTFVDAVNAVIASNPTSGTIEVDVIEQSIEYRQDFHTRFVVQPGPETGRWLVERFISDEPSGYFWAVDAPPEFIAGVGIFITQIDTNYGKIARINAKFEEGQ